MTSIVHPQSSTSLITLNTNEQLNNIVLKISSVKESFSHNEFNRDFLTYISFYVNSNLINDNNLLDFSLILIGNDLSRKKVYLRNHFYNLFKVLFTKDINLIINLFNNKLFYNKFILNVSDPNVRSFENAPIKLLFLNLLKYKERNKKKLDNNVLDNLSELIDRLYDDVILINNNHGRSSMFKSNKWVKDQSARFGSSIYDAEYSMLPVTPVFMRYIKQRFIDVDPTLEVFFKEYIDVLLKLNICSINPTKDISLFNNLVKVFKLNAEQSTFLRFKYFI